MLLFADKTTYKVALASHIRDRVTVLGIFVWYMYKLH